MPTKKVFHATHSDGSLISFFVDHLSRLIDEKAVSVDVLYY